MHTVVSCTMTLALHLLFVYIRTLYHMLLFCVNVHVLLTNLHLNTGMLVSAKRSKTFKCAYSFHNLYGICTFCKNEYGAGLTN